MERFTRKQLADITGISAETLRYYEKIGVLPKPGRDINNNYRLYDENYVVMSEFIKNAKSLGFKLTEIKSMIDYMISINTGDRIDKQMVKSILLEKIDEIDKKIEEMNKKKELLQAALSKKNIGECNTFKKLKNMAKKVLTL